MNKKKGLRRFFTLDVHNHEGFTLVELIIVIAILAILSGVAVAGYSAYIKKANKSADEALLYEVNQAFRAACLDNFYDVYDISSAKITVTDGVVGAMTEVKVNGVNNADIVNDFNNEYFNVSNAELKYYKGLRFDSGDTHLFVLVEEVTSTFDDPEVMAGIWNTFNTISDMLAQFGTVEPELIEQGLMNNISEDLAEMLGMADMIDGYIDSTNLTDEQLDEYLRSKVEGYDSLPDEEKAELRTRLKANLGVMYFANAADPEDPELLDKVMSSLDVIVRAVQNAMAGNVTVDEREIMDYYLTTGRGQDKLQNDPDQVEADCEAFAQSYDYMLGMNGTTLVVINKAIQQALVETQSGTNTAGVNTLGALYALSAGYFNNPTYWQGEVQGIGTFPAVVAAMSQPNFSSYYANQARADVEVYLQQMGQLSSKQDELDLSKGDVFGSMIGG